jgi:HK97 family phage major capsid protein/HK97 family phage prohead protease
MPLVRKDAVAPLGDDPLEYVMSDATVDRYGDTIDAKGWDLTEFRANPIALFGHDSKFIVGHWTNVHVEGDRLLGHLHLVDAVSERLKEVHALVKAGVLRAVSVGFRPIESEPLSKSGGAVRYIRQKLLECSLVAIPANPHSLQVARSLEISDDTINRVFGKQADTNALTRRGYTAGHGEIPPSRKSTQMPTPTLAQRIEMIQQDIVRDRDLLAQQEASDTSDTDVVKELQDRIESNEAELARKKRSEALLAAGSQPAGQTIEVSGRAPFAMPAKKVAPHEYILRAVVSKLLAHTTHKPIDEIRRSIYGDDEPTRLITDIVTKAATAPATTTTSGWASQLVQTVNVDFMQNLMPNTVFPSLASRGLSLNFGRNGVISIPSRAATPTISGAFVGEGAPIPVKQGAFTAQTLTPKKMAVISTFTREIANHSVPAIEGLIRDAIRDDTAVALDAVLLDATAASAIRPAGLRNGVSVTAASAAADAFDALVADIKALTAALVTATSGNLRSPVWIMNPGQVLAISLTQNAGGDFPFDAEISRSALRGYPVISSGTVTAEQVILVDAADFVSVTGDEPEFNVSDTATIHMEDTTPLAISTVGSPNTVAAPVRSLWQTDTIGIRMILPMNWALRRTGVLAWTESVNW